MRAGGGFCITDGDGVQARPWQKGRFAPVGGGWEVQLQSEEAETGGSSAGLTEVFYKLLLNFCL